MILYKDLYEMYKSYKNYDINKTISQKETMYNQWYWQVGESAINLILNACATTGNSSIKKILDLPCGHGRVLRHIRALFPYADIHACDLDEDGVLFCEKEFDATPIRSEKDLAKVIFPGGYDLIWIGSLFTHVSESAALRMMKVLSNQLSEKGFIVATYHGRWCEHVHKVVPYIGPDRWNIVLRDYKKTGYGYCDYTKPENHDYIDDGYGVSLAKPSKLIQMIESIPCIRIYGYIERGWADHQDVIIFGRPEFDKQWI